MLEKAKQASLFLDSCGKQLLEVFRIENFTPVPLDSQFFGEFYDGDSYIILITTKDEKGKISREAHMWVGDKTTADESGTAAYKIVELDDYFDRHVTLVWNGQGHESESLKNALKKCVR